MRTSGSNAVAKEIDNKRYKIALYLIRQLERNNNKKNIIKKE